MDSETWSMADTLVESMMESETESIMNSTETVMESETEFIIESRTEPEIEPEIEPTADEGDNRRYRTMEAASLRLQKEAKGYLDSLRGTSSSSHSLAG
jgi:hypothetical protein